MPDHDDTPRPSDDLETADGKSRSVGERIPTRQDPDLVPEAVLPGAVGPNIPQAGIGRVSPLDGGGLGSGEAVLDLEQKAQRAPIQRG